MLHYSKLTDQFCGNLSNDLYTSYEYMLKTIDTANLVWLMISTSVSAHLVLITALRFTHAINTNPLGMINFKLNTTSQVLSTTCIFSWIITEPAQKPLCNQKLLPKNIPFLIPSNHTFQLTPFAPIIFACKYWSVYTVKRFRLL